VTGAPFIVHEYVRWGDVDIVGIIRYDAYLRFFEFAESELLRAVGLLYHDVVARHRITLPRKVMHAEFITPARLDERLEIRTYVSAVGSTSLTLNFDMFADDGTARAKGYLVVVAVDVETLEKRPLPQDVIAALAPHTVAASHARATAGQSGGDSSASSRY
jgi:YbgC/YbaW family acyl-CoA thioester hydrolase